MSIRSELNNSKLHIENEKKAIIARGGEISLSAGLKDVPLSIFNIPADASLNFQEDNSIAYEKAVPSNAKEYALVKSIGGMTYKSNNLFDASVVPTGTKNGITVEYDEETQIFTINGTPTGSYSNAGYTNLDIKGKKGDYYTIKVEVVGGSITVPESKSAVAFFGANDTLGTHTNWLQTTIANSSCKTITLPYEYITRFWFYIVEGIVFDNYKVKVMLAQTSDTTIPYEPYFEGLRDTKPTSLESRGANLFDESTITQAASSKGVISVQYGIVENGYLKALYGKYGNAVLWYPFSMNLTAGNYTISADVYVGSACPSKTFYMGLGKGNGSTKSKYQIIPAYDVWERMSATVTLTEDGAYYFEGEGAGAQANYTALDVRFKNIIVTKGIEAVPFKPYSEEPIDTKSLPEAVQSLDGWGLGISAEYNNHIVWRNGRIIYVQMYAEGRLDETLGWRAYTANQYPEGVYCYYVTNAKPNGKLGYQTSICSHFNNVNGVWGASTGTVGDYSDHSSYSWLYFKTDKATVEEWKSFLATNDVRLVYELAEPIETDITHLFTDTSPFIKVQGGGSVIANNEREQAVPSTLKYTMRVGA